MWMSLSLGRWTCLLTLAVVMLFSASQGHPMLQLPCCKGGQMKKVQGVQQCFEQESRNDCPHHYYVIQTGSGPGICVQPKAPWLKQELGKGDLTCDSIISNEGRFEVLDVVW